MLKGQNPNAKLFFSYSKVKYEFLILMMELFLFKDKTFGLKNKKGAKQQKYIKNVTQQVKSGQQSGRQVSGQFLAVSMFASQFMLFL